MDDLEEITPDGSTVPVYLDPNPPIGPVLDASEAIRAERRSAYIAEADPIFFMSHRGEATHEEWLAKVTEIKERHPYNTEPEEEVIEDGNELPE